MSQSEAVQEVSLPESKYFMVLWGLPAQFGGMTTMSLHRAASFKKTGGRKAPVVTFEPASSYDRVLERLIEQGKVAPDITVLNIFQHYRSAELLSADDTAALPAPPTDQGITEASEVVLDAEGRVFQRSLIRPDGKTVAQRYFYREDETVFFRDDNPVDKEGQSLGRYLTLLDRNGNAVLQWRRAGDFYRYWLRELADGQRTTLIVDSAFASGIVGPLVSENIVKLAVMHNSHIAAGGDPYQGKIGAARKSIVEDPSLWDGIVFLTQKHRQDFADRFGSAPNLFVISNPKPRMSNLPPFEKRNRHRGVMVCRLEPQKNVAQAVDVMEHVRKSLPDAVLDVYGTGSLREDLQSKIADLGLTETVKLHGHKPNAAKEFETAAFSLLTSRNEGQPLALMESMGYGCPPVSYDIRYGPSDVIQDGHNGFLVSNGNAAEAAARVVQICTNEELARDMGRAGWEYSDRFSDVRVMRQWQDTLEQVWRQQDERLVLKDMQFHLEALTFTASGGIEIIGDIAWVQVHGPAAHEHLSANLVISRRSSGRPVFIPATVAGKKPNHLHIRAAAGLSELEHEVPADNNELDISIQVEGNNVLRTFRVGFPGAKPSWRPYATVHGSLSLKNL